MLQLSSGVDHPGTIKWDLALCLLLAWIVVYFCIWKGIKSSGKVMLCVGLLVPLVRGTHCPRHQYSLTIQKKLIRKIYSLPTYKASCPYITLLFTSCFLNRFSIQYQDFFLVYGIFNDGHFLLYFRLL